MIDGLAQAPVLLKGDKLFPGAGEWGEGVRQPHCRAGVIPQIRQGRQNKRRNFMMLLANLREEWKTGRIRPLIKSEEQVGGSVRDKKKQIVK